MLGELFDLAFVLAPEHPFWDTYDHPLSQAYLDHIKTRWGHKVHLPAPCPFCLLDWLWNDWQQFLARQN